MAEAERFEYRIKKPTTAQTQDPTGRDVATEDVTEGWVDNGLSKSVTVSDLDDDTWHQIEVRGVNRHGNGPIASDWAKTPADLPDAAIGSVSINAVSTVRESATQTLTATVTGANSNLISYAWTVLRGGGTITGSGRSVTYNAPAVSADTAASVQCVATVRGDGTGTKAGTSATATDSEAFTITNFVPASRPSKPTSFSITVEVGGNQTLYVFRATADDGGSPITGWDWQRSATRAGLATAPLISVPPPGPLSSTTSFPNPVRFSAGSPGVTNYYRIRAINAVGTGDWSDIESVVI